MSHQRGPTSDSDLEITSTLIHPPTTPPPPHLRLFRLFKECGIYFLTALRDAFSRPPVKYNVWCPPGVWHPAETLYDDGYRVEVQCKICTECICTRKWEAKICIGDLEGAATATAYRLQPKPITT